MFFSFNDVIHMTRMTINSVACRRLTQTCDYCLPKDPDRYLMSRVAKDIRSAQSQSADLFKSLLGSIKTDWRPASTWELWFFASETAVTLAFIIVSISLVIPMDMEFLTVQEMFLLIDVPVLCSWIASPCSKRRGSVYQILTSPWITDSQKETNHRSCRPSTVIYFFLPLAWPLCLEPMKSPLEDLQILML